jgi:hypothetical protein
MSDYLRKAAELIDKAVAAKETDCTQYPTLAEGTRMRAATAYTALAAIDKGLMPPQLAENIYREFGT